METNTPDFVHLKRELECNSRVFDCAKRYGNTGDHTSMKICYLLRRCPGLSVSQIADLAGVSVSAASRCLTRLEHSEVVLARRDGRSVRCSLEENEFTKSLVIQLEGTTA